MSTVKDFKYNSRDFSQFREKIIDFAKQYFPETYNDFNETSPGMMFIEMSAMVGDVLSITPTTLYVKICYSTLKKETT